VPIAVRDVVERVVREEAPQEWPLVEGLRRFPDARVQGVLAREGKADEALGFGLETVAALVTPVLWAVLSQAARHLFESTVDDATDGLLKRARRWLRGSRDEEALTVPDLTGDQVEALRAVVLRECAAAGVGEGTSERVGRAVAEALAGAPPRPAVEGSGDREE
jgi:hypothetical protein